MTPAQMLAWELEHDSAVILRASPADWTVAGIPLEEAARRVANAKADIARQAEMSAAAMAEIAAENALPLLL
jgi:hypothetical protein